MEIDGNCISCSWRHYDTWKKAVINQTEILTWTSKRGHTNETTPQNQGVAFAGAQQKPGAQKKRTAPLEWNFVSEQNQFRRNQDKNAHKPGIGPAIPGQPAAKPADKARYVPLDIDP